MNKNFNLEISSDLDYEDMVVNIVHNIKEINFSNKNNGENKILYKQKTIAVLNQDKGIENIEIRIYSPTNEKFWCFSLDEFLQTLQKAKELLIKCNQKKD